MIEQLYTTYFNGLYRFAYHYVMCDYAYDIVQEVFIRLYERKPPILSDDNIVGYLLTATKNRCMNFLRHKDIVDKHEERLVEAILSWNADGNDDGELKAEIERCMNLLSDKQRAVVSLKTKGKSYQEIADILKINVGTVNTHIARAYKVFRDNFGTLLIYYFMSRFL